DPGPRGDTGPHGPGALTLNYDATATASPPLTTIGTVVGDTFSAECKISLGAPEVLVYVVTSDGSLRWDTGTEATDNGTNPARSTSATPQGGSLLVRVEVASAPADPTDPQSDHQSEIIQLKPLPAYLNLHTAATTAGSSQTCHFSVMAFPSS